MSSSSGKYELGVFGGKSLGVRVYVANILIMLVFFLVGRWLLEGYSDRLHRLNTYHLETITSSDRVVDISVLLQLGLRQDGNAWTDTSLQANDIAVEEPSWTTYVDSLTKTVGRITSLQRELGEPSFMVMVEALGRVNEELTLLLKEREGEIRADLDGVIGKLDELISKAKQVRGLHSTTHGDRVQAHAAEKRSMQIGLFVAFLAFIGLSFGLTHRFLKIHTATQERLEEGQQMLALTNRLAKVGGWKVTVPDLEGFWSEEAARIYDLPPGEFLSAEEGIKYYHPDDLPIISAAFKRVISEQIPYELELRLTSASGRKKWIFTQGYPVVEDGRTVAVQGTIQDITDRKHADQSVRRLMAAVDQGKQSVVITGLDGTIEYVNPAFLSLTGFDSDEIMGRRPRDLASALDHGELVEAIADGLQKQENWNTVVDFETRDGEKKTGDVTTSPIRNAEGRVFGHVGLIRDITGEILLNRQLQQSQRLKAIGQLAGGVAHDFNNMLGIILGHTELMMDLLPPDDPARKSTLEIQNAAQRSSNLTRQLLTFARRQQIDPVVLDANEQVDKMIGMLQRLIGEQISLHWHPFASAMPVHLDPAQFDQVLVNLVVNARDAIAEQGRIDIKAQRRRMSTDEIQQNPGVSDEVFGVLTIADTGAGMSEEIRERIFEPFFSTKPVGQSTGLGLSTVFGIVSQNRGFIHVSSSPGEGSVFTVGFPLVETSTSTDAESMPPGSNPVNG